MEHRAWKPNVTVAALIERDGRFLLVEEETDDGLRFNQPAGHLDQGESLVNACAREALEETAWSFRPTALVGVYQWPRPRLVAGPSQAGAAGTIERSEQLSPLSIGRGVGGRQSGDVTYLRFAFCGELGQHHSERKLDAGIVRAVWMTPEEIRASADRHRSPLIWQCVSDYLAGRRYPLELITHYG
jgi:8-oxo-dGTP pyrophosphatase MutT (NUDIX family)